MVTARQQYCEKRTKRHRVCGQELNANTTCPRGHLHADAPLYPWLWPPVVLLVLGVSVVLAYALGLFLFIGPFVNGNGATVGSVHLAQGTTLVLGAGEQIGFYEVESCTGRLRDPKVRMATFAGGGHAYSLYPASNPPYFTERPLLLPFEGVRQCATFTAPRAATYTVVYVSSDAAALGIVASSQLYRVALYHAILWGGLAAVLLGAVYLGLVVRRRNNAGHPPEQVDVTRDPIARAAWQAQVWDH